MSLTGNVNEDRMEEVFNEVSEKFEKVNNVLSNLNNDLIEKLDLKDDDPESFDKAMEYSVGNEYTLRLNHTNELCNEIITSYSKALIFNEEIKNRPLDEKALQNWFEYYAKYAIRQLGTLDDYIYHYLNTFNRYEIPVEMGFNGKVKGMLNNDGKSNVVKELTRYSKLNKYRNDITHNLNPFRNIVGYRVKEEVEGVEVDLLKVTEPTIKTNNEFITIFEESVTKLVEKFENVYAENKKS
ncbi:Cthe_2314 family HEPN domain-containing protein [Staphylococcus pseudoxylosus]|uniref:Cthe_2314 family HEPN domain-containing protein n=1 Tax=Staphylococcus pseudoxylosus TaxID=2282419 RepID=UPI00398B0178